MNSKDNLKNTASEKEKSELVDRIFSNIEKLKNSEQKKEIIQEKNTNTGEVKIRTGKSEQKQPVLSTEIKKALNAVQKKEKVVNLKKLKKQKKQKRAHRKSVLQKKIKKITQTISPEQFTQLSKQIEEKNNKNFEYASSLFSKNVTRKPFIVFTLSAFLLVFGLQAAAYATNSSLRAKNKVQGNAELALEYAKSGSKSIIDKDFNLAEYKFGVASQRFFASQKEIERLSKGVDNILSIIPGNTIVDSAENILIAGGNISAAGEHIALALEPFQIADDSLDVFKGEDDSQVKKSQRDFSKKTLTDSLEAAVENLKIANKKIEEAEKNLQNVNAGSLPGEIASDVTLIKEELPKVRSTFSYFLSYSDMLLEILGHKSFKRYLIMFQNNSEIRATGGFMGTYGLVDIDGGKVTHLQVEGPYNIDGTTVEKIHAPEALRLINPRFYFRDANWFADFPSSAKKTAELFEKAGGPTVDGVISVNASLMVDLLRIVGDVEMPEYDVTINADNFYFETQEQVEKKYDKEENRPKKFISDLFPKIIDKVLKLDQDKWLDMLSMFISQFDEKDIMIFFYNNELQKNIENVNWDGGLKETEKDYLNIVHSNVGGGKTDTVINQNADIKTEIQPDGSIINTVTLSREHRGNEDNDWTITKNVSYTRFYVPLGSTLVSAEGFDSDLYNVLKDPLEDGNVDPDILASEGGKIIDQQSQTRIYKESGKTVFGNFIGVEVGRTKSVQVKYKLPFKISFNPETKTDHYSLFFQKQSGATPIHVTQRLSYPLSYQTSWRYLTNGDVEQKLSSVQSDFTLTKDKIMAVVFTE